MIYSDSILKDDSQYVWHPFGALKGDWEVLPVKKANGVHLHLNDGRQILDAISSWWVNIHGHANKELAEAIFHQASTLEHVIFSGFTHTPAVTIAKSLIELFGADMQRAFFSDDGSTAVEVALKMAIQYWNNLEQPKRKIVALEGAYHGDTFGAMAVGDRSDFTKPFHAMLFEVEFIPFPEEGQEERTIQALEAMVSGGQVAAFIYEPLIQGAGGMRIYSPKVLDKLIAIAKAADVLCIADEVMTGFGRTGSYFASQQCQNQPDLVCLSKGITGGFLPMGLTLCNRKVEAAFLSEESRKALYHGHSYTANPIACAVAVKSLEILQRLNTQEAIKFIQTSHSKFAFKIQQHSAVSSAKVCGTIVAIEIKVDANSGYFSSLRKTLYNFFLERNILLRPLGNTIYIMPPYVISAEELRSIYEAITGFLDTYKA